MLNINEVLAFVTSEYGVAIAIVMAMLLHVLPPKKRRKGLNRQRPEKAK